MLNVYSFFLQPSNSAGRHQFPWHEMVNRTREFMKNDLFITHPVMYTILYHFQTKYVNHVYHSLPLPNQVCKAAGLMITLLLQFFFLIESNNDHHRNSRTCFLVRFRFKLSEMKFFAFEVFFLFSSKFAKHKCFEV